REDTSTIAAFEDGLAAIPEVRHAERLFGDPDYLVRVATTDLNAYQELRDQKLAALPGVQRVSSTIVMKRIVDDRPYPTLPPPSAPAPERLPAIAHPGGGKDVAARRHQERPQISA